jgi:hypothetical protein
MEFNINALEHGGLTVQFGKANPKTYKAGDLAGRGLLHFLTQVHLNWELYGFAVVTTLPHHPDTVGLYRPAEDTAQDFQQFAQVVPMEKIEPWFVVSPYGGYRWIIYDRTHSFDPWDVKKRVIPNVMVFARDPPHPLTGELRSKFMPLLGSFLFLSMLRRCSEVAEKNKCAPMIVTEHVDRPQNMDVHGVTPYMGCDTYEGNGPPDQRTRIGKLSSRLSELECKYTDRQLTLLHAHLQLIKYELQSMGDQVFFYSIWLRQIQRMYVCRWTCHQNANWHGNCKHNRPMK